ncbi:MAG: hypothetical protein WA081_03675 [Desulfosalsimonadaceae bacterium]
MGAAKDVFDEMADNWPSEIIARTEIKVFTGGLISPKYIANLDSKGEGPFGRIKSGRKTGYQKRPFVKWLRERSIIEIPSHNPGLETYKLNALKKCHVVP